MMTTPILITFVAYFIILLVIGLCSYRRDENIEGYLLGGRGMGAWVTALSTQASDMSGWLLMGLPGVIYASGAANVWIAIGLFLGTVLNWKFVSGRLRLYTQKTNTITLPCFFEERFADPTGLLRTVAAITILVFFTIYVSSGLTACGKLFESTFGISYGTGVWIGGIITVAYTFTGGYLAVCWTDVFQGALMVLALVVVPAVALVKTGGVVGIQQGAAARGVSLSLIPQEGVTPLLAMASMMAWGLGYFGQPHLLVRFMSAKSLTKLSESMVIALAWVAISLTGAVLIGVVGIGLFTALPDGDPEKVFISMIHQVIHPWAAGIMLSAILSAIMSTIDSQLLVSASALSEDLYRKVVSRETRPREVVLIGRICVVVISVIALGLALRPDDTILGIVAYSWGGFGAAFGPVILFALFSRRTTWLAALLGLAVGTLVLVVWKQLGLGDHMYEIVPGFVANSLVILIVNQLTQQEDPRVLRQFDEVVRELHGGRQPPATQGAGGNAGL
ncbi:MAG: sodium/proline symporter PutP [Planctomycetes bacterium]|jgi:sodium/proline symporter|nr:sodium/proline symporter PutP [Planctomycetota bacterium]